MHNLILVYACSVSCPVVDLLVSVVDAFLDMLFAEPRPKLEKLELWMECKGIKPESWSQFADKKQLPALKKILLKTYVEDEKQNPLDAVISKRPEVKCRFWRYTGGNGECINEI